MEIRAVRAFDIESALADNRCPYCGKTVQDLLNHIRQCDERMKNVKFDASLGAERWAMHEIFGKALILNKSDGLCLIESDSGRFVVPATSLSVGQLNKVLGVLDETELSDDELCRIINLLRVKVKDFTKVPQLPELWPGCQVEIQLGDRTHRATIRTKKKCGYVAVPEGREDGINISNKHILRILS